MSETLLDEVTSINSIYGEKTLTASSEGSSNYVLSVPTLEHISLRLEFPHDYPDAPPSVLGTHSVGGEATKGDGNRVVGIVRDKLAEVFTPGIPCIFDLLEESAQKLQQLGLDQDTRRQEQQAGEAIGQNPPSTARDLNEHSDPPQSVDDSIAPPPWVVSELVTEKKSVFVARAAFVTSVDQAKSFLGHLLATDKKVAKAAHNITAWRIKDEAASGVRYQDCDDDGETAAGGRLLHLLELMNVWNAMVVVTRWYGGIHLGPDRFRLINQCARDAITKGDFAETNEEKGTGKKKSRK